MQGNLSGNHAGLSGLSLTRERRHPSCCRLDPLWSYNLDPRIRVARPTGKATPHPLPGAVITAIIKDRSNGKSTTWREQFGDCFEPWESCSQWVVIFTLRDGVRIETWPKVERKRKPKPCSWSAKRPTITTTPCGGNPVGKSFASRSFAHDVAAILGTWKRRNSPMTTQPLACPGLRREVLGK